jgi:hypothetical protein
MRISRRNEPLEVLEERQLVSQRVLIAQSHR